MSGVSPLLLNVNDDLVTRYSLTKLLRNAGFRVLEAASGREALESRAEVPDLVLLDVRLPDMDGYAVCRRLKADSGMAHVPVLMVSAILTEPESRVAGLEAGADGYLAAPVDSEELVAYIRALLRSRAGEARARLREAERRNQAVLDSLSAHIAVLDPEGRIVAVNQAWRNFALANQAGAGTDIGANYLAVCQHGAGIGDPHASEAADGIREVLDGRLRSFTLEYPCHSPDVRRWYLLQASPLCDGGGAVIAHVDITKRRLAEEELLKSRQNADELLGLLDAMQRHSPAGLAFISRDYTYVRCNDALAALNGLPAAEHIGRSLQEVIPEVWPTLRPILAKILATGEAATNVELSGHTRANPDKLGHWLATYYPVRAGGAIIGIGATVIEITDRVALEERMRQSQKMEAVGRLAGGIAHDFNNLLTVINGYAHVLLDNLPEAAPSRGFADEILQAGRRAAALTQQLLAFSRRQVRAPRELDLNELVTETSNMLRRLIGEDVELITELDATLGRVEVDPAQMTQVLLNLATNARDAMPEGGRLTITTANADAAEVVLSVADNGTGMSAEVRDRAFEPFFTTKELGRGTGLGLATVHGIVEQSGGRIEIESQLGHGCTFRIYLPRLNGPGRSPKSTPRISGVQRGTETILLVEDDDAVRAFMSQGLQALGYRVLVAGDGAVALQTAQEYKGPIDLLVSDVVMPNMGGRLLAEQLKVGSPGLKVLYVSGYTTDEVVRRGVMREEMHFLQKPFSTADLSRKVREALDSR